MRKVSTVAVYVKSESCDEYLYCFENKTLDEICTTLRQDMHMFKPMCNWLTMGDDDEFLSELDTAMRTLFAESWKPDEYEEEE